MNGDGKIFWLLAALGAGAAYWWWTQQSGGAAGDSSGDSGSGDSSGSGGTGSTTSAYAGAAQGLTDAAASVGYTLGVYVPKGLRNHNPGNLRYVASIQWNGQVGDDGTGYAVFDTDEHGVRALGHQLQTYAGRGLTSVTEIISTYAPSNENDTQAYIADVAQRVGVDPNAPLDVYALLPQLVDAIIHHEQGVQPFSATDLQAWVYEP